MSLFGYNYDRLFLRAHKMFEDCERRDKSMADEIAALRKEVKELRGMCSQVRFIPCKPLYRWDFSDDEFHTLTAIEGVELLMAHLGLELHDEPATPSKVTLVPIKKGKK